jgi:hypothetical protein
MPRPVLIVFAVVLVIAGLARETRADEPLSEAEKSKQSQAFADQAYVAYERQDWPKAVAMYMESYKLVPTADVLFNIATIYDKKIHDKRLAIEFYRRHNAATDANPELVSKAIARMSELGHEEPAPAVTTPPPSPVVRSSSNKRLAFQVAGLVTGVVGLAGLGVGIGYGVDAMNKSDQVKAAGCKNNTCPDPFSGATERSAFTSATISTVGLVVGGALTVVGLTLILVAPKKEAPKRASAQLTPAIGAGQIGFSLSGSFL